MARLQASWVVAFSLVHMGNTGLSLAPMHTEGLDHCLPSYVCKNCLYIHVLSIQALLYM